MGGQPAGGSSQQQRAAEQRRAGIVYISAGFRRVVCAGAGVHVRRLIWIGR